MLSLKNYIKDIKYKSSYFDVEDNVVEDPFSLFFACMLVCLYAWYSNYGFGQSHLLF